MKKARTEVRALVGDAHGWCHREKNQYNDGSVRGRQADSKVRAATATYAVHPQVRGLVDGDVVFIFEQDASGPIEKLQQTREGVAKSCVFLVLALLATVTISRRSFRA